MTGKSSSSRAKIRGYIRACARLGKESKNNPKNCVICIKQEHGIETSVQVDQQIKTNGKTDLNDKQLPGAPWTASTDKILALLLKYVYI